MPAVNVVALKLPKVKAPNPKQGTKQLKKGGSGASKAASSTKKSGAKSAQGAQQFAQAAGQRLSSTINKAAGYRRNEGGDALWLPNTERPNWLDGSYPGDRGFDPLGLGKKQEYVQLDIDQQDITAAQNKKGGVVGRIQQNPVEVTQQSLSPYNEVFSLPRFRECELIHGRWAMLATLGCVVAEGTTGVSWVDAGKVELDQPRYLSFNLPFTITQLVWIEVILVGGAEIYRNSELDVERRYYPGGPFDPLGLASDPERAERLKEAEIKHARLAMVAFLGFGIQALSNGQGAIGSIEKFVLGN